MVSFERERGVSRVLGAVVWSGLVRVYVLYPYSVGQRAENLLGGSRSTETGNGPGLYERQIICTEWITTTKLTD